MATLTLIQDAAWVPRLLASVEARFDKSLTEDPNGDELWLAVDVRPGGIPPHSGVRGPSAWRCGTALVTYFGEWIMGCLRSKNSVSPTLSLLISSMFARNSAGISLRSPSRAAASDVKYMTMV
jgi:hypothetical protein